MAICVGLLKSFTNFAEVETIRISHHHSNDIKSGEIMTVSWFHAKGC